MTSLQQTLDAQWRHHCSEFDNREIWDWAQDGELPGGVYAVSGKLDIETAPMIKQPLRDLKSALIRQVICMCGVQCLKTLLGELWLLWSVENDPGPSQWLQPTDQDAAEHAKERFIPLLEQFPRVHKYYTPNRHDRTTSFIRFLHCFLRMEGAENMANLQRKSIKNQMRSEVWLKQYWPPGRLKEADSRLTQFVHNSKSYTESQPGFDASLQVDDMHAEYLKGNQCRWEFPCQGCGKLQPYHWSYLRPDGTRAGLRWTESERTVRNTDSIDPNEKYRWNELIQTIRLECIFCGHAHHDDTLVRRRMSVAGQHVAQNPEADPFTTSYNWGQLAMPQLSWFETKIGGVKNFLIAHAQSRQGNEKPLIDFFMKVTAEPYNPRKHGAFKKLDTIVLQSSPEESEAPLEHAGILFPHRCMTVDVQAETFWILVLAFSPQGHALILHAEEVPNWSDVAQRQEQFKVPASNVGVDVSHREKEVVRECCRHGAMVTRDKATMWNGWVAFRGSDAPHFAWEQTVGQKTIRVELPYSWPPVYGDPCDGLLAKDARRRELAGRYCAIITWSNPSIKDVALSRLRGRAEAVRDFVLHGDWNEEYARQRDSQKKVLPDAKYSRAAKWRFVKRHDDHLNDCYCMALTFAYMRKWLVGAETS